MKMKLGHMLARALNPDAARAEDMAKAARQLGFQHSPRGRFGLLKLPFPLLSMGDNRWCQNVLWGDWKGMDVKEFDYKYVVRTRDEKGNVRKTYYKFSCAVTRIDATGPHVSIDREGIFTRVADHVGLQDISFESEDFNRAFNVTGDRKFATDVVDGRMMQWLLETPKDFAVELSGRHVLCHSKQRDSDDIPPLLDMLKGFIDHIPRVVYELHAAPTGGANAPEERTSR
ncbi:MAG: hypothetical protein ABR600_12300 [Actinomycetota bacterium]